MHSGPHLQQLVLVACNHWKEKSSCKHAYLILLVDVCHAQQVIARMHV